MVITTAQIRGARGILNWSQQNLSDRTNISTTSIGSIEKATTKPRTNTLRIIQSAFENAGIEFTSGSGVRLKDELMQILEGDEALNILNNDILKTLSGSGGEVLIFGLEERVKEGTDEYNSVQNHLQKITAANITEKIIVKKGDENFIAPKEYYRWIKEDYFSPYPYFIYGDKMAMINWGPPMKIIIIDSAVFSQTFKNVFEFVWERAEKIE